MDTTKSPAGGLRGTPVWSGENPQSLARIGSGVKARSVRIAPWTADAKFVGALSHPQEAS